MQHLNLKEIQTRTQGFTLVEILIAISILSLSILATFTAVSNSMRATNFSEEQVIAYHLADEALEYIRNKRDTNGIQHVNNLGSGSTFPWMSGIANLSTDPCYPGNVCYVDVPNNTMTRCTSNALSCPALLYNSNMGVYEYVTGNATVYKRSVSIVLQSATEATVTVSVAWTAQGVSKTYTQTLVLRNWTE